MDPITEWEAAYDRVRYLVDNLDPSQLQTFVPACPDWTVRDLLSHMVGLGADVVAGDEPDDHNPTWTQAQVDARADRSAAELLEEWAGIAPRLTAWMQEHGPRPLGDVVIHEQDLRGAVGVRGGRHSEGLLLIRDRMAGRFAKAVADLPPIALVGADEGATSGWVWMSREGSSDQGTADPAGADVVVEAPAYDLARALMSRRTEEQLRAWTTRGDVGPYLRAFAGLGDLPEAPLAE